MRLKPRGFTLIELLVVVAIIALLIAILLPSLATARERARVSVCGTRMRSWGQGFHMYASDYYDALPLDGGDGTSGTPIGVWSDPMLWFNGVTTYMGTGSMTYNQLQEHARISASSFNLAILAKSGSNSAFICPSAILGPSNDLSGRGAGQHTTDDTSTYPGFFATWGYDFISGAGGHSSSEAPMLICYAMNSQLRALDYGNWQNLVPPLTFGIGDISKLSRLSPNSKVALVAEKRIRPDELPFNDAYYTKDTLVQNKAAGNRFTARHNKGGNITFADGHVEWLTNKVVSNPTKAVSANFYNLPNVVIWNPTPYQ